MKYAPVAAAALALVAPFLAACNGPLAGSDEAGGGPRVVASFYPLQYVAERVTGDQAQVTNLTSPGREPHDLELTVMQTAEVTDADLVIYEKGLQPDVEEAVDQNRPDHVVEATDVVDLEDAGASDLHFWLSPRLMVQLAEEVRDQMSDLDPEHQSAYDSGFRGLRADLVQLDTDYRKGLANCEIDTVVVSHDAFGYLEQYGLHFESVVGLSPHAEPSPAHVAELEDLIKREGITTVFSEPLATSAMSESISADLGLDAAVLDPIEGLGSSTSDEDYLSLMRKNLAALQKANRCR